jgi:hypothetical protein
MVGNMAIASIDLTNLEDMHSNIVSQKVPIYS